MIKNISLSIIKAVTILLVMAGFSVAGIGHYGYQLTIQDTPIQAKIQAIQNDQDYVKVEAISTDFLEAIVAIEDHRFYKHGALDGVALMRATLNNIKKGEVVEGGSTITQQLAKNLYLNGDKTLMRKLKELFIAYALEQHYTKEEILELYVNVIYYGDGYTGIQEATIGYFGKMPAAISYEEATLLAGLPQAPSRYALSNHYDRALKRQQQVINALENKKE